MEFTEEFIDKFWARVTKSNEADDDCWQWRAYIMKRGGYGRVTFNYHALFAHRVAWTLTYGDPGNLFVLHKCDNPRCCRPSHLFLGTQTDNMHDMWDKNRGRVGVGEKHGHHKLTATQVQAIRMVWDGAWGQQVKLAKMYGVSQFTISRIVNNKSWKSVETTGNIVT